MELVWVLAFSLGLWKAHEWWVSFAGPRVDYDPETEYKVYLKER
jgi:hypothetical protein